MNFQIEEKIFREGTHKFGQLIESQIIYIPRSLYIYTFKIT